MRINHFVSPTLAALALTFAATGCSETVSPDDAKQSVEHAVAAVKLAEETVPGTAFELDEEGKNGWDVDVVGEDDEVSELRVNAEGTKVSETRADGRIDIEDRRRLDQASVSMSDAIETASEGALGRVMSAELDRFRVDTLVWEIEFTDGEEDVTVSVDASTGEVANVDRD